jgi:hypothetical protein
MTDAPVCSIRGSFGTATNTARHPPHPGSCVRTRGLFDSQVRGGWTKHSAGVFLLVRTRHSHPSLTPSSLVYLPSPIASSANSYAGTTTLTNREVVWFDHQAKPCHERGLGNRITKDPVISPKHTVKAPVSLPPGQLDPLIPASLARLEPHPLV